MKKQIKLPGILSFPPIPEPRFFYIYDILSEKILAVYGSALGEEASKAFTQLLQNHGPHVLMCTRKGERRHVGERIPGF